MCTWWQHYFTRPISKSHRQYDSFVLNFKIWNSTACSILSLMQRLSSQLHLESVTALPFSSPSCWLLYIDNQTILHSPVTWIGYYHNSTDCTANQSGTLLHQWPFLQWPFLQSCSTPNLRNFVSRATTQHFFDYCDSDQSHLTMNNTDTQCVFNRLLKSLHWIHLVIPVWISWSSWLPYLAYSPLLCCLESFIQFTSDLGVT